MSQIDENEFENHATALDNHAKAVKVLLQKMNSTRCETEKALELLRLVRKCSISHFSPEENSEIFRRIIKFRNNPKAMRLVMDLYKLQCVEAYFTQLEGDVELDNEMKKRLLFLLSKQLLGLSYDNGKTSFFVIGQKREGLNSLFDMEASMQKKVNLVRYEMEKAQARYENLMAEMEGDSM